MSIDEARPRHAAQPHHVGASTGGGAGARSDREDALSERGHLWLAPGEQDG